jgi:hypothetical protein
MISIVQVEKEPMNVWSPRADLEAGDSAFLPVDPQLAIQVINFLAQFDHITKIDHKLFFLISFPR